jgi:cytoskeletal protein RodZ
MKIRNKIFTILLVLIFLLSFSLISCSNSVTPKIGTNTEIQDSSTTETTIPEITASSKIETTTKTEKTVLETTTTTKKEETTTTAQATTTTKVAETTTTIETTTTETTSPQQQPSGIQITSLTSPINRGASATISVHTAPNILCTITVYYKSGPSQAQGLGAKTSDGNGDCSWTWKVGTRTTPGNWRIVIAAQGEGQIETYFTVTD